MSDHRPLYERTQVGWILLLGLIVLVPVFILLTRVVSGPGHRVDAIISIVVDVIVVATLLNFATLTVRVERARLAWHFGMGLVRFSIALDQITEVTRDTVRWTTGFGIHRTARGWLHNVNGREVVVITRKNGRRTLLGTDEPLRLVAAIERARTDAQRLD